MSKELPSVFANKIEKEVLNNKSYSYSKNKEDLRKVDRPKINVEQQINNIFSSPKYVYKASVKIITKDNSFTKQIIGKNNGNLITLENEQIPISEIVDIYFDE